MAHVYVHENHTFTEEEKEHTNYSVEVSLGISYIDAKATCTSHFKDVLSFIERVNKEFDGKVFGEIQLITNVHERQYHNNLILLLDRINEMRKM